jgi:acyl carrier protein
MGKIEEIISKVFEIKQEEIKKDLTPEDIEKWDSLSQLNLLSAIEDEFKINLEFDEIFTVMKINDIYKLLEKKGVL